MCTIIFLWCSLIPMLLPSSHMAWEWDYLLPYCWGKHWHTDNTIIDLISHILPLQQCRPFFSTSVPLSHRLHIASWIECVAMFSCKVNLFSSQVWYQLHHCGVIQWTAWVQSHSWLKWSWLGRVGEVWGWRVGVKSGSEEWGWSVGVKCGGEEWEILLICAIISWWVGFVTDQNKHGKILSQLCEIFSTNCVTLSLSFWLQT